MIPVVVDRYLAPNLLLNTQIMRGHRTYYSVPPLFLRPYFMNIYELPLCDKKMELVSCVKIYCCYKNFAAI